MYQKAHVILTKDVLDDGVIPGQFSTLRRCREFNNEKNHYPHFEIEKIAEAAV